MTTDPLKAPLIILGGGGHALVVAETIIAQDRYKLLGYIDFQAHSRMDQLTTYLGDYSEIPALSTHYPNLHAVVGIGANHIRLEEATNWPQLHWATIVHPTAWVSPSSTLGEGTVVFANASVQAFAQIGKHCILNTASTLEHETSIGDFTHVGPSATTGGGVTVGSMCFMGLSSTILPGLTLLDKSRLGAGAVLTKSPPHKGTFIGCPAKELL